MPFMASPSSHLKSPILGFSVVAYDRADEDEDEPEDDDVLEDDDDLSDDDTLAPEDELAEFEELDEAKALDDELDVSATLLLGSYGCGMNNGTTYSASAMTSSAAPAMIRTIGSFDFFATGVAAPAKCCAPATDACVAA